MGAFRRGDWLGAALRLEEDVHELIRCDDMTVTDSLPMIDQARLLAEAIREGLPDASWETRVYAASLNVLNTTFGAEWMEYHVLASDDKSPFFRNRDAAAGDESIHRARVLDLAETILNLQKIPGLLDVLVNMRLGHVEDRFAELEVGKILALSGADFKYVAPGGDRGSSYDLEVATPAGKVCADVKCKVEDSRPNGVAILNTLKASRSQLPADEMGAFFVKIPQTWAPDGDIAPLLPMLEEAAAAFLRGTRRVVAVVMYFNIIRQMSDRVEVWNVYKQMTNEKHRFGSAKVRILPQDHQPFLAPRPDWVRLAEICR